MVSFLDVGSGARDAAPSTVLVAGEATVPPADRQSLAGLSRPATCGRPASPGARRLTDGSGIYWIFTAPDGDEFHRRLGDAVDHLGAGCRRWPRCSKTPNPTCW